MIEVAVVIVVRGWDDALGQQLVQWPTLRRLLFL